MTHFGRGADPRALARRITALDEETGKSLAIIRGNLPWFPGEVGQEAHFLVNEGGGNTQEKVTGNEGTVSGAVWGQDEDGRFLFFDGVDDEVDFGATNAYHSGISSIATWEIMLKPELAGVSQNPAWQQGSAESAGNHTFNIALDSDNDILGRGRNVGGGGTIGEVRGAGSAQLGRLTHIRMTWEDGATPEQSLYVTDIVAPPSSAPPESKRKRIKGRSVVP